MLLTIVCAVAAEHIRHFEPRAIHFPGALSVVVSSELLLSANQLRVQIERTLGRAHLDSSQTEILRRGSEIAMTKQQLDGAQIGAGLEEMDGKGVAQRVRRDRLGEVRPVPHGPAGILNCGRR